MTAEEEVTRWLNDLGRGDPQATQDLWERYFAKLALFARRKLETQPRRAADEEDVALSAMNSFCRGMAEHRFAGLRDRADLWKLLLTITARKACASRRRQRAAKRGGGQVRGESAFRNADADDGRDEGIAAVLGHEPTPELACLVADDCRRLLERLGDETLRQVAQLTLEGYGTEEIASQLGCLQRTIQRKLAAIREIWALEVMP
jgi:DNA-directed RNA polymerase specialized sigma24 family protein